MALSLSLLIHVGGISAYYLARHVNVPAKMEAGQETVLVVEMVDEQTVKASATIETQPTVVPEKQVQPQTVAVELSQPKFEPMAIAQDTTWLPTKSAPTSERTDMQATSSPQVENVYHSVTTSCPLYSLNPKPVYPTEARRKRQEGLVSLHVLVTKEGAPQSVVVAKSSGYQLLDDSACKSVTNWKFTPATQDGRVVDSEVEIPVRFKLLN